MGRLLVVLGTFSGAGKSFLTTAICRFYRKRGLRVAPFKAQNMSLNAVAVHDGEMAWAQFVQALACEEIPSVRFNPVLLKPVGDARSELILLGRSCGFVHSAAFDDYRERVRPVAFDVLRELLVEYDVVVAEGAGSPVEVNIKRGDFANMALAVEFGAPVLLVADIDRGGVFAQIVGTYELLEPDERKHLKGVIINRFRGFREILEPGLKFIEEKIGVPVLAVLPYMDHALPPEDSLDLREKRGSPVVGVIRYPRVSNFSDVMPLFVEDVGIRWCSAPEDLEGVSAIVLPGSRRVLGDLRWLKNGGLYDAIIDRARRSCWVVGICGGYHMLLDRLEDPEGGEGGGMERGLGLIPGRVVYGRDKRVEQVRARWVSGVWEVKGCVDGYRIHTGRVEVLQATPLIETEEGEPDGAVNGNVVGTHLHNIFFNDKVRWGFVKAIGGDFSGKSYELEMYEAFDRLSDEIERHEKLVSFLEGVINGRV